MIFIDANNLFTMRYSVVQRELFKDDKILFKKTGAIDIDESKYIKLTSGVINLVVKELARYQTQFKHRYGDIIIASDYKKSNYWRKTIYPNYKACRDIDKRNAFDKLINKNSYNDKMILMEVISKLGFIVLDKIQHPETKETVEADDIIGVLTRMPGKHLICSADGDFDQLLVNPNIKRFNLFESKIVKTTNKKIQEKNYKSLILGQAKDDIPNVKYHSELSDDFIKWMKNKHDIEITKNMIDLIQEKYSNYMDEYRIEKLKEDTISIAKGKRKQKRNLTAYAKPNFGEVKYNKMLETIGIDNFLNENKIYRKNFELNKQLYFLDNIPKRIIEIIGKSYLKAKQENTANKYEAEKLFYKYNVDILLINEFF